MKRNLEITTVLAFLLLAGAASTAFAGPPPKVTAADPPSAEQGTVGLDVRILGSNFAPGSTVRFLVAGTNDEDEILVNSVTFVDSGELGVNIDVDSVALIGDYDIEVLSNGRRGKGREKFAVTQSGGGNPSQIFITGTLRNAPGDSLISTSPATPYHEGEILGEGHSLVLHLGGSGAPFISLYGDSSGNLVTVETPCPGDPTRVCFSNGDPVMVSYNIGARTIAPHDDAELCDGTPTTVLPRDMTTDECLKVYVSSGSGGRGTDPTSKKRGVKLRCGKQPNEGDHLQLTCTTHDAEGCQAWELAPCLDNAGALECGATATGSERLVCQLYEVPLQGKNRQNIELGEYEMLFAISIVRNP